MRVLKVNLPRLSYEIFVGWGQLGMTGQKLIEMGFRHKAVIITNPVVKGYYASVLQTGLESAGFNTAVVEVPEGEEFKSLEWAGRLYQALSDFGAERMTPVLALGGGVIGDLAGFVAATYLRGVPLVQAPTSLLAQVDSSTGGKVAVDHGRLKNLIGSFYQPSLVVADIATLKTLPENEFVNGLAEMIKHGVILDRSLFEHLENNLGLLKSKDQEFLEEVIYRSVAIKAGVVEKDEQDRDFRNILNFGHTVGHALESVSAFGIKHGSGVAIGMAAAVLISQRMGVLSPAEMNRVIALLSGAGLPTTHNIADTAQILQAMQYDKKKAGGKIRFILLRAIGEIFMSEDVNASLVEQVLKDLYVETPNLRNAN